jgi:GTP pyrophosphokinase
MVSVRKSHQVVNVNFQHWLAEQALPVSKKKALELVWQDFGKFYQAQEEHLIKAMEMVEILSSLNLDKNSLVAAFVTPLSEVNLIPESFVDDHCNKEVIMLCHGVEQMAAIKGLGQPSANSSAHFSATLSSNKVDNIRRMLLAMVDDVRAVVIKLAERLCDLREQKNTDEESRVLAAKESANIYAPLANRLGIGQLKWELEDISFRYLHPQIYKKIAKQLDETRLERERYMADFVGDLNKQLAELNINGSVEGRPKHIYSIWKKMQQKSLDFEQLFDVRAVRIVVEKVQDCYSALGIVHTQWHHLAKEFSDYVATPKPNGYQSIHTVVIGPEGKSIEVQIRTQQMHDDAELGVAAHWRYKEGTPGTKGSSKTNSFDEKISWLRKILQWQEDVSESGELLDELRSQVFEDRIYVFTPSGDVIDLPMGATPLDFAYYIHSNVGHCCIGAKILGKIVPFTYQLKTGDQVEILTSKQANPSRDWLNPNLNYIHSSRARAKVQHFFKLQDRDKHVAQGKALLDAELEKLNYLVVNQNQLKEAAIRFNVKTINDLYAAIGSGNARLQQIINYFKQIDENLQPAVEIDPQSLVRESQSSKKIAKDNNGITVSGVGNLLTHMAKCCSPVPGDAISGFITQGRGISVHRQDCEQLANSLTQQPERFVEVQWGIDDNQSYQASVQIIASDRQGLFRDISTIIANEKVSIVGIDSHSDSIKQTMSMIINMEVTGSELLARVITKLRQLDDVIDVKRL